MTSGISNNPISGYVRPLEQMRELAVSHFDNYINIQGYSVTRQNRAAMDERKLRYAEAHIAGGEPHALITGEAEAKQISPEDVSKSIIENAASNDKVEIWRMEVKAELRRAKDKKEILGVFAEANVDTNGLMI